MKNINTIAILLFLFVCTNVIHSGNDTFPKNYIEKFSKYRDVIIYTDKNLDDFILSIHSPDLQYLKTSKNITGMTSYRVIIDEKGNFKDALLLNSSSAEIDSLVYISLSLSKFKKIFDNKKREIKYSFIIAYFINKGKIYNPVVNGVTYGNVYKKENDNNWFDIFPYRLSYKPRIFIPDSLMQKYKNKIVVITATIGFYGYIKYAEINKSVNPIIDRAAVDATMRCKFKPLYKSSKEITIRINIPYRIK